MVSGSRLEGGNGTQNLSASVRRTIQSIKEIVGDHSDADIYSALKETNMDPNETTQKLLNQDPFHEVKRKRDKKKEVIPVKPPVPIKPRKPTEQLVQEIKPNTYIDRNPRRPVFNRINAPDTRVSRQFRVVRDNRHRETKPPVNTSVSVSTKEPQVSNVSEKSSSETSKNPGHNSSEQETMPLDPLSKHVKNVVSSSGKRPLVSNVAPPVQSTKTHDSHVTSPNSSVVGVYSSSSDPVHIPSLASRPSPNVGAIKREVGAVGVRRHSHTSENSQGQFRSFPPPPAAVSKTDQNQPSHSNVSESVPNVSSGRPLNNQYNSSRPHSHQHQHQHQHQPLVTHQKATQANKEWKPKSSQKPSVVEVGVIGTPKKTVPTLPNNPKELTTEDKLPKSTTTHEGQNVILAAHIRVSESDRIRLTFGSLGIEDSPQTSGFQDAEESHPEPMPSLSASSPVPSDDPSGGTQPELVDERVPSSGSGSISPVSEQQPNERLESSSSPQNMENYTNIRLVRHNTPSEPHQQQPTPDLPTFSAYDPQTGYDISYFRPASDESLRGQVLQVPQEGFSSHVANNSIPATTIPMVQQQQVAQMYPQVHLPHFANLMPYRQFLSPVYVPPMVMPGYSNNPTYSPHPHPHPSSGSSYLLMPGVNPPPHVTKYAIPQYKSLQAGSPTGFGNFTAPNGYALNTSGIDDSARLKYKDGNVYVPNPQAETSELWMNPREMHYNMGGQGPHGAYHGAGQSSHVQFPGMYQAGAHHMGGNVAAGAPGTQVAGYQQPQLSQLSWTGNF